jgi:hypothetical protein
MDVESKAGSGEIGYGMSRAWTKEEAEKAVRLWRKWIGV